jgi:hypothetical protein
MTPASGLSQNGSPTSEDSSRYSPLSQPFGERPLNRTSAGAAVRQSISNLPSPPPFTPEHTSGLSMASPESVHPAAAGNMSPLPFSPEGGMSAAASCASSGPTAGAYTPGVTSGWGFGSSTKTATSEGFAFARHPTATSQAGSPDVQPFAGNATPDVNVSALTACTHALGVLVAQSCSYCDCLILPAYTQAFVLCICMYGVHYTLS